MAELPSSAAYDAQGVGTATLEQMEGATRYNAWLVSKLSPYLGDYNLELGAGHGTLTELVSRARDVVVTEPSETGRAVLSRRFAENPRVRGILAEVDELPAGQEFDCIYSANVLEHVADDVRFIEHCAGRLRSGGHFVAIVPAGVWLYSPFDAAVGHQRRYGRADRVRLVTALDSGPSSLRLVEYRHFNPVGALGWFVRMRLLRRRRIPTNDLQRLDRWVPLLRQLDPLPLPFGQNLLMAFVKC